MRKGRAVHVLDQDTPRGNVNDAVSNRYAPLLGETKQRIPYSVA